MRHTRRLSDFLRDRVSTRSQALGLAALDDRLLAVQREQSPTPPLPSDEEIELHNYNQLIREGGCPVYSVDLVGKVTQYPEKYHEMLSPWVIGDDYMVFRNQLLRWQGFRQWQKYNRGDLEPFGKPTSSVEVELAYNNFTRYRHKFVDYTSAIRDLLRSCSGVQDHAYTFCDIDQQDRLTTWMEYLGYEYWRLFQYKNMRFSQYNDMQREARAESPLQPLHTTASYVVSTSFNFVV